MAFIIVPSSYSISDQTAGNLQQRLKEIPTEDARWPQIVEHVQSFPGPRYVWLFIINNYATEVLLFYFDVELPGNSHIGPFFISEEQNKFVW